MPPFGARRSKPPETPLEPAETSQREQLAEERLAALLAEQSEIERELAEHRTLRERWVATGDGTLIDLAQTAEADDQRRQRAEQLVPLVADAQAAVRNERAAKRAAQWDALAQDLEAAMQDTVDAIRGYDAASDRYRDVHWRATQSGFDAELREQFVSPPSPQINPWVLHAFTVAVEQCQQRQHLVRASTERMLEALDYAELFDGPAPPRFVPKRVDPREVEAISAVAGPRRVRIDFGPVKTSSLNVGIARMRAGEEHVVPARAAFALVASGIASYADVDEPAAATAA
jgi:hypothetical protein